MMLFTVGAGWRPGAGTTMEAVRRRPLAIARDRQLDQNPHGSTKFVVYWHPADDDVEMRGFSLDWEPEKFGFGRELALDTAARLHPEFPRWCQDFGMELVAVGQG